MKKVIIDCDPGYDDAMALVHAFASDAIEVVAVMATAGNTGIDKTYPNVVKLVSFLGRDVAIGKGIAEPLLRSFEDGVEVHGETGIDGVNLPDDCDFPELISSIDLYRKILKATEEKITIVTLGPLTNLALLLKAYPECKDNIEEVVMMAGSLTVGNVTPSAEYNVYADAESCAIVMASGLPITMAGLNITNEYQLLPETFESYRSMNRVGVMIAEVLDNYNKFYQTLGGTFRGPAIHDYCAVAFLTNPELFTYEEFSVDVECCQGMSYGRTIMHHRGDNRVKVLTQSNHEGLTALLKQSIRQYN